MMNRIAHLMVAVLLILLLTFGVSDAFLSSPNVPLRSSTLARPSSTLLLAGFGASKKKKNAKSAKLKPRQQWGRFNDLKDSKAIQVAAQKDDQWFEVGEIKSEDDRFTEAAVVRHRSLLTDHARRMFPVQILANDQLTWGYLGGDDEWIVVSQAPSDVPDDINKRIGFRGFPDPTGFYASSGTGLKAGDSPLSTDQAGYLNMKSKGITGHTGHEIHD